MATLATRVVSGKGLLRLPASADLRKAKRLSLYVDVIRLPFNGYYNNSYSPPKGRYATLNVFKTGYLQQEICVEYPRQRFDFVGDMSAQTSYYVKCAYHLLLSAMELGYAGLGYPLPDIGNPFEFWYHTDFAFDEIKIVCYSDSALRLVVESEEFQLCPEDEDPDPFPPPPPPSQPEDVPPGTSLGEENTPVSPPYQEPDDGGGTVPYPGDDVYVPPPEVAVYRVAVDLIVDGSPVDTAYTRPFNSPDGVPTIVSAIPGGSGYIVVTVNIPGVGNLLIGATSFKEDCSDGFGSSSGSLSAATARVETSTCPLPD